MAVTSAKCDRCDKFAPLQRTYARDGVTLRMLCAQCRGKRYLPKEVQKCGTSIAASTPPKETKDAGTL